MRRQETSHKSRSFTRGWKHKRAYGKRSINKSARSLARLKIERGDD